MADSTTDSFFEQILAFPAASYVPGTEESNMAGIPMMLQLSSGNSSFINVHGQASGSSKRFRDYGRTSNMKSQMGGGGAVVVPQQQKPTTTTTTTGGGVRGRVRARRGQATDPHSIAERLRRERIAERIRALQELVPTINKTDRAVMLDEILDYVKFLQLQVKVLTISRLGGAAVPLDIPILSVEEEEKEEGGEKERWSSIETEKQVVKLMEENNIAAAMQFLQSKSLCIMPLLSLASPTTTTTTTCYRPPPLPIPNH